MFESVRTAVTIFKRRPSSLLAGGSVVLAYLVVGFLTGFLTVLITPNPDPFALQDSRPMWVHFAWMPVFLLVHTVVLPVSLAGAYTLLGETVRQSRPPEWNEWGDFLTAARTFGNGVRTAYLPLVAAAAVRLFLWLLTAVLVAAGLLAGFTLVQLAAYAVIDGHRFLLARVSVVRQLAMGIVVLGSLIGSLPWVFHDVRVVIDGDGPLAACWASGRFAWRRPRRLAGYAVISAVLAAPGAALTPAQRLSQAPDVPGFILLMALVVVPMLLAILQTIGSAFHVSFYDRWVGEDGDGTPDPAPAKAPSALPLGPGERRRVALAILLVAALGAGGLGLRWTDWRPAEPEVAGPTAGSSPDAIVADGIAALNRTNHRTTWRVQSYNHTSDRLEPDMIACIDLDYRDRQHRAGTLFWKAGNWSGTVAYYGSQSAVGLGRTRSVNGSAPDCPEFHRWGLAPGPGWQLGAGPPDPPVQPTWEWALRERTETSVRLTLSRRSRAGPVLRNLGTLPDNDSTHRYRLRDGEVTLVVDRESGYIQRLRSRAEYTRINATTGEVDGNGRELFERRYSRWGEDTVQRPDTEKPQVLWLEAIYRVLYY